MVRSETVPITTTGPPRLRCRASRRRRASRARKPTRVPCWRMVVSCAGARTHSAYLETGPPSTAKPPWGLLGLDLLHHHRLYHHHHHHHHLHATHQLPPRTAVWVHVPAHLMMGRHALPPAIQDTLSPGSGRAAPLPLRTQPRAIPTRAAPHWTRQRMEATASSTAQHNTEPSAEQPAIARVHAKAATGGAAVRLPARAAPLQT